MKNQKIKSYILIIVSILIVAGLGTLFVNLGMDWYATLKRPSEFVPDFIIPIVWSIIYVVFAIALCLWVSKEKLPKKVIVYLIISGILNVLWCLIFFTLNQTLWGLITIIFLLIFAYLLVVEIGKYSNLYYYMTVIYPLWASIATTLNLSLWILN